MNPSIPAVQTVQLKDGRRLAYNEYGDPNGKPVFYFHGWPSARSEWEFIDADGSNARRHGARIIATDRPGYGLSDSKPGRTLLDWPDDVVALADYLHIDHFSILAYSGGVPAAFACAYKIAACLIAVSCMAVFAPFEKPGVLAGMASTPRLQYRLARYVPWLYRFMNQQMATHPDRMITGMMNMVSAPDAAAMSDEGRQARFMAAVAESARGGGDGGVIEGQLNSKPWGFPLDAIQVPIYLWQGDLDNLAPPAMARYLAGVLPNAHPHFEQNDGHLSIALNHIDAILDELLA
jgi:pimeloyl-ACP methyl ester carboxylesterase